MITLEKLMEPIIEEEKKGNYESGINVLKDAQVMYPELRIDICYEMAMLYFRNEEYYNAILVLIEVYKAFPSKQVLEFIYEAYVLPNRQGYKEHYNRNKQVLDGYSLLCCDTLPEFDSIGVDVVWQDEDCIIYYTDKGFVYRKCNRFFEELMNQDSDLFFMNAFCIDDILKAEEVNRKVKFFVTEEIYSLNGLYLYYEKEDFYMLLSVCKNIDKLVEKKRLVFLIGEEQLVNFLEDLQLPVFKNMLYYGNSKIGEIIINVLKKKQKRIEKIYHIANSSLPKYYKKHEKNIIKNIESGKPKILFMTTIYSTAIQYHAANLYRAAVKKNMDVALFREKSCIHTINYESLFEKIIQLKPDIIVCIDHFRFETYKGLFPEVVFLSWIQDPLPIIMDKDTPNKLLKTDFILNHYTTWKKFHEIGYRIEKLIDAPVPGNQDIYKRYTLTEVEKEKYYSDICIVAHNRPISLFVEEELSQYDDENFKKAMKDLYLSYYKQVLEEEKICNSEEECEEFIKYYFLKNYNVSIEERVPISKKMYQEFGSGVYRQAMVRWIIRAGFTNVKVWGSGWEKDDEIRPYAMGTAQNGEELSKILQCAKIVIGSNCICTGAARVWETMLSGGFYMSNFVPEEHDAVDLRKILNKDDFVMFKSKKELLEKIEYYLNHEEERQEMARRGREKALEKMTFDVLLDRILEELPKRLSQEEEEE